MTAFAAWYLIITSLGWLAFPLVYRLFPTLSDRGYTLARAAGLLVWAYAFWLFTTVGISFNNLAGILFGILPLVGLSTYAVLSPGGSAAQFLKWIRGRVRLILTTEVLFLVAFALLAMLRAGNPSLDNAEKPMELMFINSILRSHTFPPHDGWLSGHAISYYYFGYVMTAMLTRLSGVSGSVGHNLMTSLVFALGAVGSYGILFNLLSVRRSEAPGAAGTALLAPLFMLVVSNLEGFLEVLHRRGILWGGTASFWTWLDIKDLNQAPAQPLGWIPDRFWWWWRASRVISDYDLLGQPREVIDEFPFFSFLHADLHPHVLAIPFILLTISVALHIFLGGWEGETGLFGLRTKISGPGFVASALLLGGIGFLNIWDILLVMALIILAHGLRSACREGWSWEQLVDMLALGMPLAISAVLLYLPFYLGFSSQAGGLLPNIVSPTRGSQLWVMFAPLLVPLLAYMAHLSLGEARPTRWRFALSLTLGLLLLLSAIAVGVSWIASRRDPGAVAELLSSQNVPNIGALVQAAMARRFLFLGGLLTMVAVFVPAVAYLAAMPHRADGLPLPSPRKSGKAAGETALASRGPTAPEEDAGTTYFVLLLAVIACLLLIGPEFVYLRDQFGYRLNTIFKFYFQAWLLWSMPAALAVALLLRRLGNVAGWIFRIILAVLLLAALTYPVLAIANKTNNFKPHFGWTLDEFVRLELNNPDEAAAMRWLMAANDGVVAEAVGGSYTDYGRVSVYTGLPGVLGWPGHEVQWRGTADPQGSRQDDIRRLYELPDWESARQILARYGIRYVFVGGLEHNTYTVQLDKFEKNLSEVFQRGQVSVFEFP